MTEAEILKRAKTLRETDPPRTWASISAELGKGRDWLRRRIEPGYAEFRNQQIRQYVGERRLTQNFSTQIKTASRPAMTDAELRAHRLSLPDDTRDFTQRFFGDPIFERSALAKLAQGRDQ